MKSHDFDRIVVPVYLICGLFIVLCWIKYGLTGLAISFLILFYPIVKSTKQHYIGSEEFGINGYGNYHESILFRLINKRKRTILIQ